MTADHVGLFFDIIPIVRGCILSAAFLFDRKILKKSSVKQNAAAPNFKVRYGSLFSNFLYYPDELFCILWRTFRNTSENKRKNTSHS